MTTQSDNDTIDPAIPTVNDMCNNPLVIDDMYRDEIQKLAMNNAEYYKPIVVEERVDS